MKILQKYSLSFFSFIFSLFLPKSILAIGKDWNASPTTIEGGVCAIDGVATIQGIECLFFNILQVIVYIGGIACFVMIIVGGYKYIFSGGESKSIATAQSSLSMAIFGLVGVVGSFLIIQLIKQFTGVNVTDFIIPK